MAPVRVVMLIDQLEAGGAQRQFCLLASALQQKGCAVDVLHYGDDEFFADSLRDGGTIPTARLQCRSLPHLVFRVRQALRRRAPDTVIAFLHGPSLLAELAGLPRRRFGVIVSQRNLDVAPRGPKRAVRYFLHRFADVVVSNSYAQRDRIDQIAPHLNEKTTVIVNGVDTRHFFASPRPRPHIGRKCVRVLVLARLAPHKNALRFIEAVHLFRSRYPEVNLQVDWYGKRPENTPSRTARRRWRQRRRSRKLATYCRRVEDALAQNGICASFRLHGPTRDVRRLYHEADVLCLPSLYEGCSNVIGEAMACGLPVLASRVSDNVRLVEEGRNGLLFDPLSVEDMVSTIGRFVSLPDVEVGRMGREGRKMAECRLSQHRFVDSYVELVTTVALRAGTRRVNGRR